MTDTINEVKELADVWVRVRGWPEPIRLALASRILQSVEQERGQPTQRRTFADLIGLWDTGQPPATDEDVDRMLAEERLKKFS